MATPGYPQMGQMPPMGGPPMGGPPMGGPGRPGGPPMQPPMRRGTSKAVPVVVSAGLAVGVFCGLLFGVGKESEAVASASAKAEVKPEPKAGSGAAPATTPKPTTPPPAKGSATVAGAGSAAAGSAAPTIAKPKTIKLTLTIKPDGAAEDAKLWIDDKEVEGMTIELPAGKKSVKVEVKSRGYRSIDKKIQLAGGDTAIELEMAKRSSGGGTGERPPKRPDRPPSNEDNGLIDI